MKCLLTTALLATLLAAGPASDDAALIAAQKPCYPLTTCIVKGKPLGGGAGMTPVDMIYEGRLVSFCCSNCQAEFKKSPADYLKKLDDAIITAQSAGYPLDTCPNSGEKLDAKSKSFVVGTKLMKTCCDDCKKEILADPTKALAILDAAYIAKQEKTYPLAKCPISDEPVGDKPVKVLYGLQLVEFCCKDCVKDFNKDPKVALAKLAAAKTAQPAAPAQKTDAGDKGGEHGEAPHGGH